MNKKIEIPDIRTVKDKSKICKIKFPWFIEGSIYSIQTEIELDKKELPNYIKIDKNGNKEFEIVVEFGDTFNIISGDICTGQIRQTAFSNLVNRDIDSTKAHIVGFSHNLFGKKEEVEFELLYNSHRMLVGCHTFYTGKDHTTVRNKVYKLVTIVLNYLSFYYEIPINISKIDVGIAAIASWKTTTYTGFTHKNLDLDDITYDMCNPINYLFAFYREALNSNNPFYKFLTYFKIYEGIKEIRKKIKDYCISIGHNEILKSRSKEIVEDSKETKLRFGKELIGKKFSYIMGKLEKEHLRTAVAHFRAKGKDIFTADNIESIEKIIAANMKIQYIVRVMTNNEMKFLKKYPFLEKEIKL